MYVSVYASLLQRILCDDDDELNRYALRKILHIMQLRLLCVVFPSDNSLLQC